MAPGVKLNEFFFVFDLLFMMLNMNDAENPEIPAKLCDCGDVQPTHDHFAIGSAPWMVSFHETIPATIYGELIHSFVCAGSLISSGWILTSAMCVDRYRYDPYQLLAILGNDDLRDGTITIEMVMLASAIEVHPFYRNDPTNYNVALVKAYHDAITKSTIRPICLPAPNLALVDCEVTVQGWGKSQEGLVHPKLKNATLSVISHGYCVEKFVQRREPSSILCATGKSEEERACELAGGSPVVYQCGHHYSIVGLVPNGRGCTFWSDVPLRYVRVSEFVPWILRHGIGTICPDLCCRGHFLHQCPHPL